MTSKDVKLLAWHSDILGRARTGCGIMSNVRDMMLSLPGHYRVTDEALIAETT